MADSDSVAGYTLLRTPTGRFRVDIPATTLEADDTDSLLEKLAKRLEEIEASLSSIKDDIQDAAFREIEQATPRGDALAKYVKDHPPPPEWFDEPEWWNDAAG